MKLTEKLLQEFDERMKLIYDSQMDKNIVKFQWNHVFESLENYTNALQQFLLEKTIEEGIDYLKMKQWGEQIKKEFGKDDPLKEFFEGYMCKPLKIEEDDK